MATSHYYVQINHERFIEKFITGKTTVIREHLIKVLRQLKIDSDYAIEQIPPLRTMTHHTTNLKYENKIEYKFDDVIVQITKAKFIKMKNDN